MRKKTRKYISGTVKSGIHRAGYDKKIYAIYERFKNAGKLRSVAENSFAIILFDKAAGSHTINGILYKVKPKQVHLQFPEQTQSWHLQTGTEGQRLVIKKILAETFSNNLRATFSSYTQHPVLNLDAATYTKINNEFLAVKKEIASSTIFMELVNARCRLIALIITLWLEHKYGAAEHAAQSSSLPYKFHLLVDKHFKTQKTVLFYAKHLYITPNYLGIICRKQYKMSALEFIQERVLLEAKRLLHSSDKTIKEIAFDLGFKNMSYFSYFFKSKTNLTPKEYRLLLSKS
ncbi:MAG: helix-turn-helix domain-containing protein [Agriterribacter sp.]